MQPGQTCDELVGKRGIGCCTNDGIEHRASGEVDFCLGENGGKVGREVERMSGQHEGVAGDV